MTRLRYRPKNDAPEWTPQAGLRSAAMACVAAGLLMAVPLGAATWFLFEAHASHLWVSPAFPAWYVIRRSVNRAAGMVSGYCIVLAGACTFGAIMLSGPLLWWMIGGPPGGPAFDWEDLWWMGSFFGILVLLMCGDYYYRDSDSE